jgi:hypothetical protein
MKLHFKIKNPVDAYAVKFLAAVSALIGFELLFRIVALDEILIQILIFSILGAFGLYRHLKRLDDD